MTHRPQGFPAFGLSDHNSIVAFPKNLSQRVNTKKVVIIRDKRTSRKAEMGRYLAAIDWSSLFASLDTCEDMWNVFHAAVQSGFDILMPIKWIRIHPDDAPWMKGLVRLEKRAIAIMNPGTHYDVASEVLNMRLIEDHHDLLCSRLFNSMMRDINHKFAEFLPPFRPSVESQYRSVS